MSESSWSSDEEWTTIAAMVCDTQDSDILLPETNEYEAYYCD
jgi:hypothetical protein